MDFVEVPNFSGFGDVAGFGGVNAGEVSDPFPMFGVLASGDIDPILPEDGSSVNFTGTFGGGIFVGSVILLVFGGIAVVFPGYLQKAAVSFLNRFSIERIAPSVPAAKENKLATVHLPCGGGTPLAM